MKLAPWDASFREAPSNIGIAKPSKIALRLLTILDSLLEVWIVEFVVQYATAHVLQKL